MKKSVSLLKSTVIIEDKHKFSKLMFMHCNDAQEQKVKIAKYSEFGFTSLIQLILFLEPSVNRRLRGKAGWWYSDGKEYESWKDPGYMPDLCDGYNEPSDKELNKLISHSKNLRVALTLINLIK